MTVLDFVNATSLEEFYCYSDTRVCVTIQKYYKRKGKWIPKKKVETIVHSPINLISKKDWTKYKSFDRFANKDFVFLDGNTIYSHWTVKDIINEILELYEKCEIIEIKYVKRLDKNNFV